MNNTSGDTTDSARVLNGFLQQASLLPERFTEKIDCFETNDLVQDLVFKNAFESYKIGRIAEESLSYYLKQSARYKLVAEQLVISENGVTKGELDFIVSDLESERFIHIELACKFYLYDPLLGKGLRAWIGPNRNDLLIDKLTHMQGHQFPLLYRNASRNQLSSIGLEVDQIHQSLCLKGFLFTRPNTHNWDESQSNPMAFKGHYYHRSELDVLIKMTSDVYLVAKPDWMMKPHDAVDWELWEDMLPELDKRLAESRSSLLWVRKKKEYPECIFVVWW